jgi:hypothetical protein
MTDWPRLARSRALLIGTTSSADSGFPAVAAVAGSLAGMKAVLTDPALCGWPDGSVAVIRDARDPAALGLALRDLAAEADDVLLFYFAGHGFVVPRGELRLGLAVTTRDTAEGVGLPYEWVRREMLASRAHLKIVILDCSFSGQVIGALAGGQAADLSVIDGTYVLASSEYLAGHPAPGEPQTATPFTAALIATIRAGIPGGAPSLTLEDLYPRLLARLRDGGQPEPRRQSVALAGRLPFTRNAAAGPSGDGRYPLDATADPRRPPPTRRRVLAVTGVAVAAGVAGAVAVARDFLDGSPGTASGTRAGGVPRGSPSPSPSYVLAGPANQVNRVVFSPDDRFVAGGSGVTYGVPGLNLWLWAATKPPKPGTPIDQHPGPTVHGVAYSPVSSGAQHLATLGDDGTVRLWNMATGTPATVHQHGSTGWEVAFSSDGASLASSGSDHYVAICDVRSQSARALLKHPATPSGLAFSPGSKILVTGCNDGQVRLWDATARWSPGRAPVTLTNPVAELPGHQGAIPQIAFQPQGEGAFVTCSWDHTVRIWHMADRKTHAVFGDGVFEDPVTGVAFSPDGQTLATACGDMVRLWSMKTYAMTGSLESDATFAVTYNKQGSLLASTGHNTVALWHA